MDKYLLLVYGIGKLFLTMPYIHVCENAWVKQFRI